MVAKGSPKTPMTGKKGNVGGISTPGRHGSHAAAMMAGVKNLVAPGPGTKKTASVAKIRPEGSVHIDAGNVKKATGTSKMAAGSPKKIVGGSVSVAAGIRPEGSIKRDAASVIKPAKS